VHRDPKVLWPVMFIYS